MKLLVIGASGYLGNTIYKKLKEKCNNDDIFGTCCTSNYQDFMQINLMNKIEVKKILSIKPDIIFWSIYDKEEEMALSQMGLNEIIDGITKEVRFIYISTTVGIGKDQDENIVPHKRMHDEYLSKYVNGKIEGEGIVRKHSNHVIIRPGNIYGYNYSGKMDGRMKALLGASKTGIQYPRTANAYISCVNVQDLSDAIIELAYSKFTGIINISGERPVSHYDFNIYLAKIMNIDNSFIIPDYKEKDVYHNLNNDKRKVLLNTLIREI